MRKISKEDYIKEEEGFMKAFEDDVNDKPWPRE